MASESRMIAFLFPGQGAQFAGFLHSLGGAAPHVRIGETIEEASDVLHLSVLDLDHADALRSTVSAAGSPALFDGFIATMTLSEVQASRIPKMTFDSASLAPDFPS